MDHATVFTIDKSQAIRLSKAVALPENVKRIRIIKFGQARLITPADAVRIWLATARDGLTRPLSREPQRAS